MTEILLVLWIVSGVASHIYWVTNRYDYTTDHIPTTVLAAVYGPFAWWIGYTVYGDERQSKMLFRKRQR